MQILDLAAEVTNVPTITAHRTKRLQRDQAKARGGNTLNPEADPIPMSDRVPESRSAGLEESRPQEKMTAHLANGSNKASVIKGANAIFGTLHLAFTSNVELVRPVINAIIRMLSPPLQ